MYDTINISLSNDQCQGTDFLKEVPQHLSSVENEGQNMYGRYIYGHLNGLNIKVTENKVQVENSLPKYYLGDNFKTLTRGDTKRAIQQISDSLHLPMGKGNVHRIDFAANIIMKHPESSYYPYLGECQYYKRLMQDNGLYYSNGNRQLLMYGKVKEQTLKGELIPELYRNRNVLRYEIRYKKRLREQFNRPEITAGLLFDEEFYQNLLQRWRNEFLSIQKIRNQKIKTMVLSGSKKEFVENLALLTILDVGQPLVLAKIKEAQNTGQISKKQAHDLRSTVRQLAAIQPKEEDNDLMDELTRKVKEIARVW